MRNASVTFSVIASGTSPLSYRWRFNNNFINGATSSTYTILNAGNGNLGNYTVVVTNALGAVTSQVATLTFLTPVSITTQPTSLTVTQGIAATFRVIAAGSAPLGYQWRFAALGLGETNIPGATSATFTLNGPQASNAGDYRVVVSNPVSALTSQVATLTVLVPPAISQQPQGRTVQSGSNVTFSVTATGASLSYQWRKNGTAIPGATGSSFTIIGAQAADAGSYTVVVSNAIGSTTSAAAVFRVLVPPQSLNIAMAAGVANISFQSLSGLNYVLEYKDYFDDAAWTSRTAVPGNGGLLLLSDPSASVPTRFYRVRAE